jgi:hypothetical protein
MSGMASGKPPESFERPAKAGRGPRSCSRSAESGRPLTGLPLPYRQVLAKAISSGGYRTGLTKSGTFQTENRSRSVTTDTSLDDDRQFRRS